jgi:hypothetical protein
MMLLAVGMGLFILFLLTVFTLEMIGLFMDWQQYIKENPVITTLGLNQRRVR